jgi:hypothetical protein
MDLQQTIEIGNFNHSMFLQFVLFIYLGNNVENSFNGRRIPHFWRRVGRPEHWPEDVAWQSPSARTQSIVDN